jgi:hypothetical protein
VLLSSTVKPLGKSECCGHEDSGQGGSWVRKAGQESVNARARRGRSTSLQEGES